MLTPLSPPPSIFYYLRTTVFYGFCCYLVVLIIFICTTAISAHHLDYMVLIRTLSSVSLNYLYLISSLILAPIFESLPIWLIHTLWIRKDGVKKIRLLLYFLSVFSYALILHGAQLSAIAPSIGFIILACLFNSIYNFEKNRLISYVVDIAAHITWNILSILTILMIQFIVTKS